MPPHSTFVSCHYVPFDCFTLVPVTPDSIAGDFDISSLVTKHAGELAQVLLRGGEESHLNRGLIRLDLQFDHIRFLVDRHGCVQVGTKEYRLSTNDLYDLRFLLFTTIPINGVPERAPKKKSIASEDL